MRKDLAAGISRSVVVALWAAGAVYGQDRAASLIEQEYDARYERLQREYPLHYALIERDYDGALRAMPLVADIDAVIADGFGNPTPAIRLAAQAESADAYNMVQALLMRYGADPDVRDGWGLTALHYAARNGNLAVAELLLEHGADVNAAPPRPEGAPESSDDQIGTVTPLYLAYSQGRYRVARFLETRGAEPIRGRALMHAQLSGAIAEGFRTAEAAKPEGLTPIEAVRFQLGVGIDRAREFLAEHDMHEVAAMLDAFSESVVNLIESRIEAFPESGHPAAVAAWAQGIHTEAWTAMQEQFPELAGQGGSDASN